MRQRRNKHIGVRGGGGGGGGGGGRTSICTTETRSTRLLFYQIDLINEDN